MEINMEYIKISELKKEAKKLRKENQEIKNHSDSLQKIAKKYGKEKWEDLLDSSVFLLSRKESKPKNHILECNHLTRLIKTFEEDLNYKKEILNSNNKEAISDLLISELKRKKILDIDLDKQRYFIDLMSFLFVEKEISDVSYFKKLFDYEFLKSEIKSLLNYGYSDFYKIEEVQDFFNYFLGLKTQMELGVGYEENYYIFLEKNYKIHKTIKTFSEILILFTEDKRTSKELILEKIKDKKSLNVFLKEVDFPYYEKNNKKNNYINILFPHEEKRSIYSEEFMKKHLSVIAELKK
tara:strand:- start:2352 stop:3236 length:885 start_codon:yes stop_codon:yes gene_type:complete